MSSFNRRWALIGSLAALAGCGFRPAYGPGGSANRLLGQVRVDDPVGGRPAYLLTREIEERLGVGSAAGTGGVYGLSYVITIDEQAVAISSDNVATRFNLTGSVTYALRDLASEAVLVQGQAANFTSYSASGTPVATQAAARDAEQRLMVILADQVINRLIAESGNLPA
ncbi:MAG: LPS assembly lipoprotein LptE [Pseudomonadota bacterium]